MWCVDFVGTMFWLQLAFLIHKYGRPYHKIHSKKYKYTVKNNITHYYLQ